MSKVFQKYVARILLAAWLFGVFAWVASYIGESPKHDGEPYAWTLVFQAAVLLLPSAWLGWFAGIESRDEMVWLILDPVIDTLRDYEDNQ